MTRSPEVVQRSSKITSEIQAPSIFLPSSENRKPRGHNTAAPTPDFVSKFQAGKGKEAKEKGHMPVGSFPFYQERDNFSLNCYLQVTGQQSAKPCLLRWALCLLNEIIQITQIRVLPIRKKGRVNVEQHMVYRS